MSPTLSIALLVKLCCLLFIVKVPLVDSYRTRYRPPYVPQYPPRPSLPSGREIRIGRYKPSAVCAMALNMTEDNLNDTSTLDECVACFNQTSDAQLYANSSYVQNYSNCVNNYLGEEYNICSNALKDAEEFMNLTTPYRLVTTRIVLCIGNFFKMSVIKECERRAMEEPEGPTTLSSSMMCIRKLLGISSSYPRQGNGYKPPNNQRQYQYNQQNAPNLQRQHQYAQQSPY